MPLDTPLIKRAILNWMHRVESGDSIITKLDSNM